MDLIKKRVKSLISAGKEKLRGRFNFDLIPSWSTDSAEIRRPTFATRIKKIAATGTGSNGIRYLVTASITFLVPSPSCFIQHPPRSPREKIKLSLAVRTADVANSPANKQVGRLRCWAAITKIKRASIHSCWLWSFRAGLESYWGRQIEWRGSVFTLIGKTDRVNTVSFSPVLLQRERERDFGEQTIFSI